MTAALPESSEMMIPKSVAEILKKHVTFELEAIDRMYLNAYVPSRQTGASFASFVKTHLSALVEDADLIWLGTAEEKTVHLTMPTRIDPKDPPHAVVGEGDGREVWYFPDRLPIGIHLAGRGVVVYVVTDPWLEDFRLFLERHAALLRALPAWTLRIVVPPQFPDVARRSKLVVWNQLLTPLPDEKLDELRWDFEQLRTPTPSRGNDLDERFHKARAAFSGPRYKALYRAWKEDGEAALASARSQALGDAVQAGAGRVEIVELGHRYGHLSPLVAVS